MGRERKGERVRGSWARRGWGSGGVLVMACGLKRGGDRDEDGERCLSGARGGSGRATGAAWEVRTFVVHLFFCFPSLLLLYSFFFPLNPPVDYSLPTPRYQTVDTRRRNSTLVRRSQTFLRCRNPRCKTQRQLMQARRRYGCGAVDRASLEPSPRAISRYRYGVTRVLRGEGT